MFIDYKCETILCNENYLEQSSNIMDFNYLKLAAEWTLPYCVR